MKGLLAFVFVGTSMAKRSYGNDKCAQPRVTGPCMAYFQRYYYDQPSDACKEFVYGGCRGNGNNFESQQACERACVSKAEEDQSNESWWSKKPQVPWWPEKPRNKDGKPDGKGAGNGSGAMDGKGEEESSDSESRDGWRKKWSWPRKDRGEGEAAGSGEVDASSSSEDYGIERPAISYIAEDLLNRVRAAMPDLEDVDAGIEAARAEFEEVFEELAAILKQQGGEGRPAGSGEADGEDRESRLEKFRAWVESVLAEGEAGMASGEFDVEFWWSQRVAEIENVVKETLAQLPKWGNKKPEGKPWGKPWGKKPEGEGWPMGSGAFDGEDARGKWQGWMKDMKDQLSDRYDVTRKKWFPKQKESESYEDGSDDENNLVDGEASIDDDVASGEEAASGEEVVDADNQENEAGYEEAEESVFEEQEQQDPQQPPAEGESQRKGKKAAKKAKKAKNAAKKAKKAKN